MAELRRRGFVFNLRRERLHPFAHGSVALAPLDHRICFAVKANSNLAVLRTLRECGAWADIVSGGELKRAFADSGRCACRPSGSLARGKHPSPGCDKQPRINQQKERPADPPRIHPDHPKSPPGSRLMVLPPGTNATPGEPQGRQGPARRCRQTPSDRCGQIRGTRGRRRFTADLLASVRVSIGPSHRTPGPRPAITRKGIGYTVGTAE